MAKTLSFTEIKLLVEEQTHRTVFRWRRGFAIAEWDASIGMWTVENLTSDTWHHGQNPEDAAAKCWRVKLWSLNGICKHLNIETKGY